MKKILILVLIVGCFESLAGIDFYISPGIQIGINSSKEFFYSYQITSALINDFGGPGISIGRRHYKQTSEKWDSFNYIDAQLSFGAIGTGAGLIFNKNETFL